MKNIESIEYLRDRCILIIDFMLKQHPGEQSLMQVKKVVNTTFNRGDLKGMKMISRDVNAWANGLSKNEILLLDVLLEKKFNDTLEGDIFTKKILKKILSRNKIINKDEFRLVSEILSDISEDNVYFEKAEQFENLLKEYKW